MKLSILALATLLVASHGGLPAAACDAVSQHDATAIVVPGELDLGTHTPHTTVRDAVWLINPGDEPLEMLAARGSCGCTVLDFTARVLPPKAGLEVPIRVTAPKDPGRHKTVTVTFTIRDRDPLKLPVHIATTGDRLVRAEPVDLGPVMAGATISASARLVNTGETPRRITAARPACKCVTLPDFAPVTLAPGEALDVHLDIEVSSAVGPTSREVTFVFEDRQVVKVPVRMQITQPRVEALKQHLNDLLRTDCTGFRLDGDVVTAVAWEQDNPQPQGWITCRFNDDGTLESTLFEPITSL